MTCPNGYTGLRTLALAALAAGLVACSSNAETDAPEGGEPAPGAAPAEITSMTPRSGPPGTTVRIGASGFAANSTVHVGFGPPNSEYDVIETVRTDAQGSVSATVEVPSWAEAGRDYVFVVADTDTRPKAISDRFRVESGAG